MTFLLSPKNKTSVAEKAKQEENVVDIKASEGQRKGCEKEEKKRKGGEETAPEYFEVFEVKRPRRDLKSGRPETRAHGHLRRFIVAAVGNCFSGQRKPIIVLSD